MAEIVRVQSYTISNSNATPSRLFTAVNSQYIIRVSEIGGTFYKGKATPFFQLVSINNDNICIVDADGLKALGVQYEGVKG